MSVTNDKDRDSARRLIGRAEELACLSRCFDRARTGTGQAVVLRGPAGIGRSALLDAAVERMAGRGAAVRRCSGREGDGARTRMRELFGTDLPETPDGDAGTVHGFHRALYARIRRESATAAPLVLAVDDAQWCDERTLRALDFVLRRADTLPLYILLAQRTECAGPALPVLEELLAQDRCAALDLPPLTREDAARVARDRLGPGAPRERVLRAAEASGGNPRLLTRLTARGAHGEVLLAASATAFLAGRPGHVRQLARALAVLGHAGPDVLGALSGVTGSRLDAALETLRRGGAVTVAFGTARHGPRYTMPGPVRSAVLAESGPDRLQQLRARAARVLNDAGRPAAEVADQLVLLRELREPWMLAVLREAAAEAPGPATTRAAVRYLRRVLAAGITGAQRTGVRLELARTAARVAPATALWHLRKALAETPGARQRATVAVEYGMTAFGTRNAPDATRALHEALDALHGELGEDPAPADAELRTSLRSALLVTAVNEKGTMAAAREWADAWPVPRGDSPAERQLLSVQSSLAALDGRPARQAAALARRALKVEDPSPAGWWVLGASLVLALADETDEALAGLGRALSASRARFEPWMRVAALAGRSQVLHETGEVAAAAEAAREAVGLLGQEHVPAQAMPHIALGTALLAQGRAELADTVLDRALRPDLREHIWEWHHYLYAKGRVRRALGDLDGALELWLRCGRSLDEAGVTNPVLAPWWLPATTTLAGRGRTREAAELVATARERAQRWGTPRAIGLGLLAAGVTAEGRARLELLSQSVDALAACPARLDRAKAEYQLGCELLRYDDAPAARRHLRSAIELATRCGYHTLSSLARTVLVAAGGRMRQLTAGPADCLTDGERRVALLARDGASNREIAEALFITSRTVEMHLTNVYRKLGVRGRAELPAALADLARTAVAAHAAGH
ncbi:AAA family ATPase [Streptomyces gamaensis]|uniref:AAA family ATPase n=1 Tax=Streptomyces gamaensis TaxID=1763542 RepID=A0ABW0ZA52_9ACTN